MAYSKTTWVNDQTELSAENMNHIENGVEQSYGQLLLAVDSTAPSECSTGDKYFNTTTNKIYTATGTDTWGTTGVDAELGVFYIVLDDQTIYTYDGTTLVSVGGGASGGGETLPVGSEIDFDGSVSDIPDGWEQVSGKSLVVYDLYSNASGSNTDITLSDSAANYNYIEIFYRSIDNVYSSLKVDSPNTKLINLTAFYAGGADIYNNSCNYTINGTSITRGTGVNWYILSNTTVSSSNAYNIYITKVIGYKEV